MPSDKELADQYSIGEEAKPDAAPEAAPSPEAASAREARPRDPATGQFVRSHSPRLVKIATDLGISEEEILSYTPAELRDTINDIRLEQQFNQRSQAVERVVSPEVVQAPVQPEEDTIAGEDEIAPQIVSILKEFKKEIKTLREENSHLKAYQQNHAAETFAQKADRAFANLGADYEHIIGKGSKDDFSQDSDEIEVRRLIVKKAARLAGEKATEAAVLAKIKDAAQSLFKVKAGEPKPSKRFTEEQWNDAGIARPSHRDGADEPGEARAAATIERYFQANGSKPSRNDTVLADFLP